MTNLIIPAEWFQDKNLNAADLILLAYIKDNVDEDGCCIDTDVELGRGLQFNVASLPTMLTKLKKLVYIELIQSQTGRKLKYVPVPKDSTLRDTEGYIYIAIDSSLPEYVKIGFSKQPKHREDTLQAQKPTIEFVKLFVGSREQEQACHRYFARQRIRGEWFKLTVEQAQTGIKKVLGV